MRKMLLLLSLLIVAMFLMGCAQEGTTEDALAGEAIKKSAVKPVGTARGCDTDLYGTVVPNKDASNGNLCWGGEWIKCANPVVYKGKKFGVWAEEKPGVKTYGSYTGDEGFKTGAEYFCVPTTNGHFIVCDATHWYDTANIDDYKVLVANNLLGFSCDGTTNTAVAGTGILPPLPKTATPTEGAPKVESIC